MAVSEITRMNIAGLTDETLHKLRGYFEASAECATNDETRTEAVDYLAAVSAELRTREPGAGEPS